MIRKVHIYFHANQGLHLRLCEKQQIGTMYSASIGGNFKLA